MKNKSINIILVTILLISINTSAVFANKGYHEDYGILSSKDLSGNYSHEQFQKILTTAILYGIELSKVSISKGDTTHLEIPPEMKLYKGSTNFVLLEKVLDNLKKNPEYYKNQGYILPPNIEIVGNKNLPDITFNDIFSIITSGKATKKDIDTLFKSRNYKVDDLDAGYMNMETLNYYAFKYDSKGKVHKSNVIMGNSMEKEPLLVIYNGIDEIFTKKYGKVLEEKEYDSIRKKWFVKDVGIMLSLNRNPYTGSWDISLTTYSLNNTEN